MENIIFTSLTPDELRQLFREELIKFFPNTEFHPSQIFEPEIMTGDQLCKKLGVTVQTLMKWRQKGKIPFIQIGSSIRYDLHKVIAALEKKKK